MCFHVESNENAWSQTSSFFGRRKYECEISQLVFKVFLLFSIQTMISN